MRLISKLATIANYAFDNCVNFSGELVIPNSVTLVAKCAFRKTTFSSLKLEANIKSEIVNTYAFHQSKIVGKLIQPRSVHMLKNSSFKETLLTSVIFEENSSLNTIGNLDFFDCRLEGVINLPSLLETLEKWTFQGNIIEK